MVWRSSLLFVMAAVVLLPGCSSKQKGEKIPEPLLGKWIQETLENKNASPEARALDLTYQFKPDGTVLVSSGPLRESKSYQVKDGKLIIEGQDPLTLSELTADRMVLGTGPDKMVFTR